MQIKEGALETLQRIGKTIRSIEPPRWWVLPTGIALLAASGGVRLAGEMVVSSQNDPNRLTVAPTKEPSDTGNAETREFERNRPVLVDKKVTLAIMDPATGVSRPFVEYFGRGKDFANRPDSFIQHWESEKPSKDGPHVSLFQRVKEEGSDGKVLGYDARGPVKEIALDCAPNTCSVAIESSDEAKNIKQIKPAEDINDFRVKQLEKGVLSEVGRVVTVLLSDGTIKRIVAYGDQSGYDYFPGLVRIRQPWEIEGSTIKEIGQKDSSGRRYLTLSPSKGGVVALLQESKEYVFNTPRSVLTAKYSQN